MKLLNHSMLEDFEPNLIPNNGKDGKFGTKERNAVIKGNEGLRNYRISKKKDGIRLHAGIADTVLSRSLKVPKSILVVERFQKLNDLCKELNIAIDGEFYQHGLRFNQIQKFYSNTDVTSEKNKNKLQKEYDKNILKFMKDYEGDTIEFLTTFHEGLKFWMFDGIVLDRPDLVGFEERMAEIVQRLMFSNAGGQLIYPQWFFVTHEDELEGLFEDSLDEGWEGLVLTHVNHEYKFGRNTLKQGTLLKMKNDSLEYDGVILEVEEGDKVKEGAERVEGKFGKGTSASRKKGDRVPSGKAKGFLIQFEGIGTFTVGLRGFDDEDKKYMFDNPDEFIGRHFKYKGMTPVKNYPRHAYFDCWRDSK